MINNEARARSRLLTTPKLHRRVSQSQSSTKGKAEYKCPPISTKDATNLLTDGFTENSQTNLSPRRPSIVPARKVSPTDGNCSPLSPANGVSAACTAMANACSHDHDYISVEQPRIRRQPPITPSQISPASTVLQPRCVNSDRTNVSSLTAREDDSCYCPDIKSNRPIQQPVPPPKLLQPTIPNHAKPPREARCTLRRRYFRQNDTGPSDKATATTEELSKNKLVFVSTSKTAEPRTHSRKLKQLSEERRPNDLAQSEVGPTACLSKMEESVAPQVVNNSDFNIKTDKLTVAWLSLVNSVGKGDANEKNLPDVPGEDIQAHPDLNHENQHSSAPLACASPNPPKVQQIGGDTDSCIGCPTKCNQHETDSAYSSLASSLCSPPPTSANVPLLSGEFRPSSSSRPASGSRPPSGGKRVAPCSLSSSSSSSCATSSDDDSDMSASSPRSDICRRDQMINPMIDDSHTHKPVVDKPHNSRSSATRKGHKVVTTKNGKKFLRQKASSKQIMAGHLVLPTPPHKKPSSKKDSVPMRLRALPTSFWQEPNRVNPSPYSVLPPVQPLFRQGYADNVADIRPVTPPAELENEVCSVDEVRGDSPDKSTIINGGDPDLLFRLFDSVEPQNRSVAIKNKRGRPKKTSREMPPPRLKLDNNPCIIQSITEKLFPKLTIDRGCISMHAADKSFNLEEDFGSYVSDDKDYSAIGLYALSGQQGRVLDDEQETSDEHMHVMSPAAMTRVTSLSLPQLSVNQDYSQMLSEVAAVL
uniref:uncharacterized protein LOC100178849 n=1 Tax=Ciona intestinalis TaxID=7719 RepID=UPI000180BDD5|nr:uncharacterized protein LOC100178849 [Ciona intestinalis]|eukprot:XP_018670705.1 uncharacterized protein LOC100178849 [Ciona intestinalis]